MDYPDSQAHATEETSPHHQMHRVRAYAFLVGSGKSRSESTSHCASPRRTQRFKLRAMLCKNRVAFPKDPWSCCRGCIRSWCGDLEMLGWRIAWRNDHLFILRP